MTITDKTIAELLARIAELEAALRDYLALADDGTYAYQRTDLDRAAIAALNKESAT